MGIKLTHNKRGTHVLRGAGSGNESGTIYCLIIILSVEILGTIKNTLAV
jgi:hypothetical protein